jgi:hypothetical protein
MCSKRQVIHDFIYVISNGCCMPGGIDRLFYVRPTVVRGRSCQGAWMPVSV